ncbi:modular serine protease-like [Musca autumnalis]|uniref:modular serine protease-like n=1 Tax=Musca autumnalis TaxID=221902 RepID=UPI003CE802E9
MRRPVLVVNTTIQPFTTSPPTQVDVLRCQIPTELNGLIVRQHPKNATLNPGDFVDSDGVVHLECSKNNKEFPSLVCKNGTFEPKFPECKAVCDPRLLEGLSTKYHVYSENGKSIDKDVLYRHGIPVGSIIDIACAPGFKMPHPKWPEDGTKKQTLKCLENGTFDRKREKCEMDCGRPLPEALDLTMNGVRTEPNKVPWHVAIYKMEKGTGVYICGGSIITPSLILSAAHCFYESSEGRLLSRNQFKFIAGNHQRAYSNLQRNETQSRSASKISIPGNFTGLATKNFADIALIKLNSPFSFNEFVLAICYEPPSHTNQDVVHSNVVGIVTGYNDQDDKLELVQMTTEGYNECKYHDFIKDTLAEDKFCLHNNVFSGLCPGDSGGSFAKEKDERFNILGIISLTPSTENGCARKGYVAVTNVKYMRPDLYDTLRIEWQEDYLRF